MTENETEKRIKAEVNKTEVEKFSSRWDRIKGRLNSSASSEGETAEIKEREMSAVQVTARGNARGGRNLKLIAAVTAVAILMFAAAVVIIWQAVNPDRFGITMSQIYSEVVEEEQFYSSIEERGYELADMSVVQEDIDVYHLRRYRGDKKICGGYIEFLSRIKGYYGEIYFYDESVAEIDSVGDGCSVHNEGSTQIRYKTALADDGLYDTVAEFNFRELNYYVTYTSFSDNALDIIDSMVS